MKDQNKLIEDLAQELLKCKEFQRLTEGMVEPLERAKVLAKQLLEINQEKLTIYKLGYNPKEVK